MWLCVQPGWFSIVKKGVPETWQIRARDPIDLRKFICATKLPRAIVNPPQANYRCNLGTACKITFDRKTRGGVGRVCPQRAVRLLGANHGALGTDAPYPARLSSFPRPGHYGSRTIVNQAGLQQVFAAYGG